MKKVGLVLAFIGVVFLFGGIVLKNWFSACGGWLFLWCGLVYIFNRPPKQAIGVERCYLIRRKSDEYPMSVNENQRNRAIATGDYTYEGSYGGGYYFSGDTPNGFVDEVWVPDGYKVADGHEKKDKRLGK